MSRAARQPGQRFGDRTGWGLWTYLALALCLRLPAVWLADGYEFLDQQYQYIDPAWHVATGQSWYESWEWGRGIRSWVYPGVLAVVMRGVVALGIEGALWQMVAIRLVHALFSLLPVAVFWHVVMRWRPVPRPRVALLLFAGGGVAVYSGVQPSGPTWAAQLSVAAVLLALGPARRHAALGGLCLGFAFCGRFQEALFGPVCVAWLVGTRRFGHAWAFGLGCVPGILVQGFSDLATWGTFLGSSWSYFQANVLEGRAGHWRAQPVWYYAAILVPISGLVPLLLRPGAALLRSVWRWASLPLIAVVVFALLHSLVGRKSLRFMLPVLLLLTAVHAVGVGTLLAPGRRARIHARGLVGLHAALWLVLSLWFFHEGPVRAAVALSQQRDFGSELVIVDGPVTSSGGAFYLRRDDLEVTEWVDRGGLGAWLAAHPPRDPRRPRYLMVVGKPLSVEERSGPHDIEWVGRFASRFDLRARDRRFVYRVATHHR